MSGPLAHPLQWPAGRPRTASHRRQTSPFRSRKSGERYRYTDRLTVAAALARLSQQLKTSQARKVVVSSNLELRQDGLPRSSQPDPVDTGVACYFELDRMPLCVSCDRWDRAADNIAAVAKHIEATRGLERWGCASQATLYAGLRALPAPERPRARNWRDVLELHSGPVSADEVERAFRRLASARHPDRGGSTDAMAELNAARAAALGDETVAV